MAISDQVGVAHELLAPRRLLRFGGLADPGPFSAAIDRLLAQGRRPAFGKERRRRYHREGDVSAIPYLRGVVACAS